MMSRRRVRRGLAVAAGWGLLGAVLAGCGSVAGSTPAGGAASTPGADGTAATAAASAVPQVGCASVNQATTVTVDRFLALGASAVARDLPDLGRHLGIAQPPSATPAQ